MKKKNTWIYFVQVQKKVVLSQIKKKNNKQKERTIRKFTGQKLQN